MTKSFNLSEFLPYQLAVLSERVSRRLSVEYGRSHGLNVAEWRVLVHLQRSGQVSVREIHNCVNLEKSRVSRAVSRLETTGLVQKLVSEDDGRLVVISLTEEGRDALAQIIPMVTSIEEMLFEGLTNSEIAVLGIVMEKLHATLDSDPKAKRRSRADMAAPVE